MACIGDACNEYEDAFWEEDGEEIFTEFPCPYCNEDYDLVDLCCHIEDVHFSQARNGVSYFIIVLVALGQVRWFIDVDFVIYGYSILLWFGGIHVE